MVPSSFVPSEDASQPVKEKDLVRTSQQILIDNLTLEYTDLYSTAVLQHSTTPALFYLTAILV